jgi:outer membrane receptor protein involved in Fe transport
MTARLRVVASLLCALSIFSTGLAAVPVAASAQTQSAGALTGSLIDQAGGVPISGANVLLFQGTKQVAATKSARDGTFAFPPQPPGIYYIEVRAEGYEGVRSADTAVVAGASTTAFNAVLQRSSTGTTQLREIGRVSTTSGASRVSTATTISQSVSGDIVAREGYVRIGDALNTLPGVNITGISSSIGDDQGIDIRGFGTSETQVLLDGHPVGPFGPGSGGFSFQVSPKFAIGQTRVTYGSGALGLYGTDSIGGTVDMQTLEPTRTPHSSLTEGMGNMGHSFSDFKATGTIGRFGYAVAHAVEGTYGPWKPAQRVQPQGLASGANGPDFSSANIAANTYSTSGNYLLRNDLLKVRYGIDDKTQLTVTAFSANSWDDKSGNGDNCFNTNAIQLYNAQQTIAAGPTVYPNTANPGDPGALTCNGSIAVNTNSGPACYSAQQYAAAAAGLVPGGPGPWQAHRVFDLHGRLTRQIGNNLVTLDSFTNRYTTDYNRNVAQGLDPTGKFFTGGFDSQFYQTTGLLLSDDIANDRNDFGFGFYSQHQRITGDKYQYTPPTFTAGCTDPSCIVPGTNVGVIVPMQEFGLGLASFFVRDDYRVSSTTSAYLNAWLKHSTVTSKTTFDPRLSLVFRTSPSDVLRLTGGRSDGEPSPTLTAALPNLNTTYQSITNPPRPPGLTSVGSSSNPNLQPESSTDLELAFGHRFKDDTIIQLDVYSSFEKNRIFSGRLPASSVLGPNGIPPFLLAAYLHQIQLAYPNLAFGPGPGQIGPQDLAVSTNFNAASARFQGIELSGRYRWNRRFFADYTYDVQSAVYLAVPDSILLKNPLVTNGQQLANLPLHKASVGLDFNTLHGFQARLDTYFLGENNGFGRGQFFYSNLGISQDVSKHATVNLGVLNLFNSSTSTVNALGVAPFVAENRFSSDANGLQQAANLGLTQNGLLPFMFTASLTLKM